MTDFVGAARRGIGAHETAERESIQIKKVLDDAGLQFSNITKVDFQLILVDAKRSIKAIGQAAKAFATLSLMSSSYLGYRRKENTDESTYEISYKALSACCKGSHVELCEWIQENAGFPVKLKFSDKEITCRDDRGFERGLVDLLSHASIGEKLVQLFSDTGVNISEPLISLSPDDELL